MRTASPSRLMMMARMDKEARLKTFLTEGLTRRAEEDVSCAEPLTIIVRNPDSPVARALAATLADARHGNLSIKILIGETNSEEPASAALLDLDHAEYRVLADPRFAAAHEQLVIGKTHVWIGDCLRRDPNKRDAFELYHTADPIIRRFAAISFEKLWAIGRPVKPIRTEAIAPEIIAAGQTDRPAVLSRTHRH